MEEIPVIPAYEGIRVPNSVCTGCNPGQRQIPICSCGNHSPGCIDSHRRDKGVATCELPLVFIKRVKGSYT